MSAVRRRWRFEGRVQGVGFGIFPPARPRTMGLTDGWANNWDGSVTLEAQGEPASWTGCAHDRAHLPLGAH